MLEQIYCVDDDVITLMLCKKVIQRADFAKEILTATNGEEAILFFKELAEQGFVPTEAQLANVYGPTGLDIGAETAEEIASSIIAEIQSVLNKKEGIQLRNKNTPIHQ